MPQYSFKDYVKKKCSNQLYNAVSNFISNHRSDFSLWSHSIDVDALDGDDLNLEDIEVEMVFVNGDTQTNDIEFDVVVSAEISFHEYSNRYGDSEDSCTVWFRLNCSAILDGSLKKFQIAYVETYEKKRQNLFKRQLSDALVPIISKSDLDFEAELFLKQYFPAALEFPQALDPFLIAEIMGLKVDYTQITEDCSIFGQMYFQDSVVDGQEIKAGTMLIDPRIAEIRNIGALNNTVIHECVHWYKHRLAFELVRLYKPELSNITTTVDEFDGKQPQYRTATDWMEWHARALAPKIMMPKKMFKQHVDYLQRDYHLKHDGQEESYEDLIDQLSAAFGVSKLAAKIRLVECGYEQAIGAYNWVDGQYVPTHSWKAGTLKENQTFSIDAVSAAIESLINPELKALVETGNYLFIKSHFILNAEKYVVQDDWGNTTLTDYARRNMQECALIFDISVRNCSIERSSILSCVLNRDKDAPFELDIKFHGGYENSSKEKQAEKFGEVMKENAEMYAQLTNDPCVCLNKVLKWRGLTKIALAKKIPVEEKTIRRIFNGESNGSIETLTAICLALYLPPEISFHIIDKSNLTFRYNDDAHILYRFALTSLYGKSMEEIRAFLKSQNVTL